MEKERPVKSIKILKVYQCFKIMRKAIQIFLILIYCGMLNAQILDVFNDSSCYKKQIFINIFKHYTNDETNKIHKFRNYVSSFGIMEYKNDDEVKIRLKKYFSKSIIRKLFGLHISDYPTTIWSDVFDKENPDSNIVFINERSVDDFFYVKDSLYNLSLNLEIYERMGLLDLWTIEPFLFSIEKNKIKKTYAIVGFYRYQTLGNFYGRKGNIFLYEYKGSNWILLENLKSWLY